MNTARGNFCSTWKPHCLFMPSKLKCASLYSPGCALLCITESEGSEKKAKEGRDGGPSSIRFPFVKAYSGDWYSIEKKIMRVICPY